MAKKYSTVHDISFVQSHLKELVEIHSHDTFLTHLSQIFDFKNDNKVCGEVHENNFKLWVYSRFLTGALYAIVSGNITINENEVQIILRSKMNPIGLFFTILIGSLISYFLCTEYIFRYSDIFLELLE